MLCKITFAALVINSYIILSCIIPTAKSNHTIVRRSLPYGRNCAEATANSRRSGIHEILIPSYSQYPFRVSCDSETHGGGWTVILRRINGMEDFNRNWNDCKNGFGEMDGEFFLGLDKINALTLECQKLLVVVEDFDGDKSYELYERFAIGNEDEKYILHTLGSASGTAGDSLRRQQGMKFTTFDQDNDINVLNNCAVQFPGPWWYEDCHDRYVRVLIVSKSFLKT